MIGLPENCILPGRIPRNGKMVLVAFSLAFEESHSEQGMLA
jgi:hypothetical protein